MTHRFLTESTKILLCSSIILLPTAVLADGGVGPHLFSKPLEVLGSLLEIGGFAFLLYLLFGFLVFALAAIHLVFLFFVVRAALKKSFKGKGLRYSAGLLVASYIALFGLAYALLRSEAPSKEAAIQSHQSWHARQDV